MKIQDIRLGQQITLVGTVHTASMVDADDEMLPEGQLMITLLVDMADQGA